MPEGDQPFVGVSLEVLLKPLQHWRAGRSIRSHGIETDKMNVPIIERIVALGARGNPASLGLRGQCEHVEIREIAELIAGVSFVVADR